MRGDQEEISVPKNSNAKNSRHLFSTHQLTFNSEPSSLLIDGTFDSIILTTSLLSSTRAHRLPGSDLAPKHTGALPPFADPLLLVLMGDCPDSCSGKTLISRFRILNTIFWAEGRGEVSEKNGCHEL